MGAAGTCFDPEIPIDIVNLGLVYACTAEPIDKDSYRLAVKMTLTAPGCGMGTLIADEAREKLLTIPAWKRPRSSWCGTRPGAAR